MIKYSVKDADIFGMARVGWVPVGHKNAMEVYIRTNDPGAVPHFHFRKYGKNNEFEWEICIRFDSADYFLHCRYKDTISSNKIKKDLDTMLRTEDPSDKYGRTFWEIAIEEWNRNNSDVHLEDLKQPDYTQL